MLRRHARARLRRLTLVAAPLLVPLVSTTAAFADREHFTPFRQLAECHSALRLP